MLTQGGMVQIQLMMVYSAVHALVINLRVFRNVCMCMCVFRGGTGYAWHACAHLRALVEAQPSEQIVVKHSETLVDTA